MPLLTAEQQRDIGAGTLSLDALTKKYIHDHFLYRYVTLSTGKEAYDLERAVQRGDMATGKPLLNPL